MRSEPGPKLLFIALLAHAGSSLSTTIEPLHRDGQEFKNSQGEVVRLWGVNVLAYYPDHQTATRFAENLASRGINAIRWHHMLRPSEDWIWHSDIRGLVTFDGDSRTPDPEAWDRFDFLNAELERRGIYIMVGVHWSRELYLPDDADILQTDPEDRAGWIAGHAELNRMEWSDVIDKRKMLATFDERCALIDEESISYLLEHENPYLDNLKYKDNPQVVAIEVINEFSSEYTIYMGNRFDSPDYPGLAYWDDKLQAAFASFCEAEEIAPFNLYEAAAPEQYRARSDFLMKLDRDYFERIKGEIASHNPSNDASIEYSSLWRGERSAELHFDGATRTEDHVYGDPYVVASEEDFIYQLSNQLTQADKPYVVGEINMDEGGYTFMRPQRTMMYMTAAVYGSLHNWAGLVWFAWNHGDRYIAADGWGEFESQEPDDEYLIGDLLQDAMVVDHFRTAGTIFRRGLVATSADPETMWVEDSYLPYYGWPVPPTEQYQPGWQCISSVRKMYGPIPAEQYTAPFMIEDPSAPLRSDTGQITKDPAREQLTFSAPQAEGFSGVLGASAPADLRVIDMEQSSGFATVMLVADDAHSLEQSESLLLSRTYLVDGTDTPGPTLLLRNLKPESGGYGWHVQYTRPRTLYEGTGLHELSQDATGDLRIPDTSWRECELVYRERGQREVALVTYTDTPPVVDGLVDDLWLQMPAYSMDNVIVGAVFGDSDLFGTWRTMWDESNLYYLAEIVDEAKVFDSPQPYDDDAVELYIDADNSKGSFYDGVDDFHYLFRWTESDLHFGNNSVQDASGVGFSIENIEGGGFTFEVSIPWSTLGVTPREGRVIGTEMQIDDDDDGGARDGKRAWFALTDDCWRNPSLFGEARLVGGPFAGSWRNLLLNPGAESGDTHGWESSDGFDVRATNPDPFEGSYYFHGGPDRVDSEAYQDVDVTDFAAMIDQGRALAHHAVRMRVGRQVPPDQPRLHAEFRDSAGEVLDAWSGAVVTQAEQWVLDTDTRDVPVGTRTLRVRMESTWKGGPDNDGCFDALVCALRAADSDLLLTVESAPLEVAPGDTAAIELSVVNEGERVERFDRVEIRIRGVAEAAMPLYSGDDVPLGPGSSLRREVLLAIPGSAPPGPYHLVFVVMRSGADLALDMTDTRIMDPGSESNAVSGPAVGTVYSTSAAGSESGPSRKCSTSPR
jgi:hypothetical protein